MPKKKFQRPWLAPLQRVVGESVTDPAELAAMDKIRKQLKRQQKGRQTAKNRKGNKN